MHYIKNQKGFTLVEIVASIAIMAIAFVGLMSLFGSSAKTSGVTMQRTDMMMIAQDIMEYATNQEGFDSLYLQIGVPATSVVQDLTGQLDTSTYTGQYNIQRTLELVKTGLIKITIKVKEAQAVNYDDSVFLVTLLPDLN